MFQGWRIQLREAENAFEQGRLDEASRVIAQNRLNQYLPGAQLANQVADRLAERAKRFLAGGETSAGWRDVQTAENLVGETDRLLSVRQGLIKRGFSEIEIRLEADDPAGALARIDWLQRRGVSGEPLRTLEQVARRLESASHLARLGRFAEAETRLESALALRTDLGFLAERRNACRAARFRSRELTEQLHRAMLLDDWNKALSLADELLELAPELSLAADARGRAWKMVGSRRAAAAAQLGETRMWTPPHDQTPDSSPGESVNLVAKGSASQHGSTLAVADANGLEREFEVVPSDERSPHSQFLAWVDGVGGYLSFLNDEIVIGQASPENSTGPQRVDLAIRGDISRRHAILRRRGESYTVEPIGMVQVNGRRIRDCTLLSDGAVILLGDNVRMRFCQPHPLSATARLDFLSRRRSQPYSDAVLLMAESCVLGPSERNHVVCRDWSHDVVLYRQGNDLHCRTMQPVEIDGKLCDGRARLNWDSRIVGENFSVTLEEL
jgi:tetratricopeptide (TPR) repeat protein